MSIEVMTCSHDACVEHMVTCDEKGCQLCRDIAERWAVESEWIAEYVNDLTAKKEDGNV